MNRTIAATTALAMAGIAAAAPVQVDIRGDVFFNGINSGTLGNVNGGETVTYSFLLDSDNFVNDATFPTRGYEIDLSSFTLNFSGGTSIGLSPTFAGPAYFVVRDNDPAVDGFFLSQGTQFDSPLPLDQAGVFDDFGARFNVTYTGDTLNSLDITDAAGDYDFTNLTVFGMGIVDGPFDAMGIDFNSMSITVIPAPAGAMALGLGGLAAVRRRR